MNTGADLKDWVLLVAGNILIVILAVRAIGYYAKREWGELIIHIVAGVVVGIIVWNSSGAIAFLQAAGKLFVP